MQWLLTFLLQRGMWIALVGVGGVIVWGVYQKIIAPSNTTRYGNIANARFVNFNETPKEPLFGCSAWRMTAEIYWRKTPKTAYETVKPSVFLPGK